ncbi:MAG TPA: BamA/TamA family outer membrane protein, partial [Allocoleopsis sp.]
DSSTDAIITAIQVQFLDNEGQPTTGHTQPYIITRQFELQPGDPYDETLAQAGLEQVAALDSIKSAEVSLQPTDVPGQVVMVVSVVERNSFQASFDATGSSPSALQGPFQPRSVAVGPDEVTGISLGGVVGFYNLGGNDQDLLLRLRGGENILDGEVSFTDPWIGTASSRTGYAVNVFNQRSIQGVFVGGDEDVDLPGGDDTPWVHRLGGGVQVFRAFTPDLTGAFGVSYQRVSVTDGMFSSELEPVDQQGNALTVSDSGEDDLLILRLATNFDRRNDATLPTQGDRLLLGIDQSIPVGDAQIAYTQLTGNYTAYFPVDFIGFAPGDRTLAFTVQAGTMLGDVPPYQAFNLDAGPIIRYGGLEIGTGSSFALVGAEYRFPIANFTIFEQGINLGGSVFGGYVSDLGTASEVIGQPAIVRDKPGEGFGHGVGLRANTPLGLVRLELGFSDRGSAVVFTTGDRF